MKALHISLGAFLIVGIVAILITLQAQNVLGSAPAGLAVTQKFATTTTVGPQGNVAKAITIFASNPQCTSRTISTTGGTGLGVFFLTDDPTNGDLSSTTISFSSGMWQAGSTTVVYDAGLYGCKRWTARSAASSTITVVEYQ